MARVNISIPDDLHRRAKEAGLKLSTLTRQAVECELLRLSKIDAAKQYLAELEAELGPISAADRERADALLDPYYGPAAVEHRRSA